jgi:hypothetical protein
MKRIRAKVSITIDNFEISKVEEELKAPKSSAKIRK